MRARKGMEEIGNLFDLNGKVAVVTGGSGALGRAISIVASDASKMVTAHILSVDGGTVGG